MPTPRFGTIPPVRLSAARKVRDRLKQVIGNDGYAIVSITNGGYSVCVRVFEGVRFQKESIPREIDGVSVRVLRIPRA